jgi:hypothetical protein
MADLLVDVVSILETSVDRWAAIARLDGELLARRPAPGEWSAIQALQHVVDTESAVFRARVLAIAAGADFPGFDPDAQGLVDKITVAAPGLVDQLRLLRADSLATLSGLAPEDLVRTARHAELGIVTLAELLNEWAAHDTMHIVQAERALMQAFILGSGPWRSFFADHDAEAPGPGGA